ncbi:MAG: hypothetical protein QNK37_12150 [Acidobacteriota bacterium]|nr:hypothetical protein [Acidobacteriota bacterium]
MDLTHIQETLEQAGLTFAPGLTTDELKQVQETFSFRFPPDLAAFLGHALPVSHGFVDWRRGECPPIRDSMDWPFDGLCYDIEYNGFWIDHWGKRPEKLADCFRIAGEAVARAPTLIPICGHRYIPDRPHETGNPVLSVYQGDVRYYGYDLWDYLEHELGCRFNMERRDRDEPREIVFWSDLISGKTAGPKA